MNEKEFYKKFKGVNCPACRGAKMPPFNPAKINEDRFADEFRFKSVNFNLREGINSEKDTINVNWESQSWTDESFLHDFINEIKRCFSYIGFKGIVNVNIWERGEKGSEEYEKYLQFEIT